ncbi:head-tail adaptor protein [Microvirga tunisiensis]|uniref:Head-tail adaptor protein n=1 Tax=Pannonibacter tanglangensis TaxID=2750084 RepID=A0A7X5F2P0_9HYPH|nr:head-tail adaptor protein [Pannonibacter sp. XCT-53]NBN78682.1 head-tail adaptor protein [Pannonibacter sp. XCT-53]
MDAGRLKDLVSFERDSFIEDGVGGGVRDWAVLGQRPAWVIYTRGVEVTEAGRINTKVTGKVLVRVDPLSSDLTTTDRVVVDGQPAQIRSIINRDRERRYLEIGFEIGAAT